MIKLYCTTVDFIADKDKYDTALECLPEPLRQRAERIRNGDSRLRSAAALMLLDRALTEEKITGRELVLGEHGKPYLSSGEVFFNLSHSSKYAVCAICDKEIGCDVQAISPSLPHAVLKLHPSEIASIERSASPVRDFFRIWAFKESYMKCTGKGLCEPLAAFSVDIGKDPPTVDARGYSLSEVFLSDDCACAVCVRSDTCPPVEVIWVK